jgi:aryl-alcohol dehydrogenase-like predicted oxidoreductase
MLRSTIVPLPQSDRRHTLHSTQLSHKTPQYYITMVSSKLPTRPLGKDGPQVPRLGLGLMGASVGYGLPGSDEERLAFLDKVYELGETFWDTGKQTLTSLPTLQLPSQKCMLANWGLNAANIYGDNEDIIGKWFKANPDKRNDIFLATKFGSSMGDRDIDSSPENARESLEKSLGRLGLPSVDLFYIHRIDGKTPIEKTMRAMVELKNEGKFKYIGISDCTAKGLRRAHAVHPISCIQVEYSVFNVEIEGPELNLVQTARELGVAIVAYSPLGRGILTGDFRTQEAVQQPASSRAMVPWFSPENLDTNLVAVDKLAEVAKAKGVKTSQLALAWILAQGDDFFAIPGTTKPHRLEENLASMDITLTAEEEKEIHKLPSIVIGDRLPGLILAYSYRETPEE